MADFVLKHKKTGQSYPVDKAFVIGRDKADLKFLSDDKLSRNHCKVFLDNLGFLCVEDLGATNKTWVNDEALESNSSLKLKVGDTLRVGNQVFDVQKLETSVQEKASVKTSSTQAKIKLASSDPTLLTGRGAKNKNTVKIQVIKDGRGKKILLWAILAVIGILFVLMFLYPEDAALMIQNLAG